MDMNCIRFDSNGLVPAIAQDARTKQVLMLAYMNRESLQMTLETGYATYYSRSRQTLWKKGESSGHVQKVLALHADCDGDTVLLTVQQEGPACHTGQTSCFFQTLHQADAEGAVTTEGSAVLEEVYGVIRDRMVHPKEGSYTNYLLAKGVEKIAKKVGEEATETVIAAIKDQEDELVYETGDLLYHLLVLLAQKGIGLEKVWSELRNRR